MPDGEGGRIWHLGPRPQFKLLSEFKQEFWRMSEAVEEDSRAQAGEASTISAAAFRSELVKFMERAQVGTVRELEFEVVTRLGEEVVELKYPRPNGEGRGRWNLFGWHYRLYAGAPRGDLADWLIWALAGRKKGRELDLGWKFRQNDHIEEAFRRFRRWIISRCDS